LAIAWTPYAVALFLAAGAADKNSMDTQGARELAKRIADEERRRNEAAGETGAGDETVSSEEPGDESAIGHVLFISQPVSYGLLARDGPVPELGSEVVLDDWAEGRYRVAKVGPSPLPGDRRPCAFLERV
jgi:hypothetical protein